MGFFWTVIVIAAIWLIKEMGIDKKDSPPMLGAKEILQRRYARGEIDKAEYVQKLEDLER